MITKILVSTTGFSKYLEPIASNNDIDDDAEISIWLNDKYLSVSPELGMDKYPIEYAIGFSAKNFQTRIDKDKIKRLIALFKTLSEQPATIHLNSDDSWIYLSGIGI